MSNGYVHIHAPAPFERTIERHKCPNCGFNSFFLVEYFEWYGPWAACLKCGSEWSDGYRRTSPTMEIWKWKERVKKLKNGGGKLRNLNTKDREMGRVAKVKRPDIEGIMWRSFDAIARRDKGDKP